MAQDPDLATKLFTALTGQRVDVTGKLGGSLRGQLLAVGGASRRTQSGIDLTRAAARLGVSRRTVERWVKADETGEGQRPSAEHAKNLARRSRQQASTKAGRRRVTTALRSRGAGSHGVSINFTGRMGAHRYGTNAVRNRQATTDLDPGQVQQMLDAWENGGEKGFVAWTEAHMDENYCPDFKLEQIDTVSFWSNKEKKSSW